MDIYVNRTGKMVQTGHSLLKLIQNSSLSTVDLLVRESLQNSLDAAIHGGKKVTANFITGQCERVKVDAIFTGITKALGECIEGETEKLWRAVGAEQVAQLCTNGIRL